MRQQPVIHRHRASIKGVSAFAKNAGVCNAAKDSGRNSQPFFPKEVFANQEAYDQSVASVVARIKSGAVKARLPDE